MKNIRIILCWLAISGIAACTSTGNREADINALSTPEREGISSGAILGFVEAVEKEQPEVMHSFILRRHGRILAQGWWDPYRPEYPHMLYSLSKSFTSTAIGIAQDEGLLSINDPVISFFPGKVPAEPSTNLQAMRIRDLLRMNTGHQQDATGRMTSGGPSWVETFLALEVEHKPGTHFVYNSAATYMLSAIIQEVSGMTLLEYLTPRLFEPLGIENPTWEESPEGINLGGWGLSITTEDISRFGQMLLQKGEWEGKQIVSEAWVKEATSLQTCNGSNPDSDWEQGYGYQFWMCRNSIFRGDGAFGQYCIVMPEQDAVLAITSGTGDMQGILNVAWEHLLPAMQKGPLPADEEGQSKLKKKLASLAIPPEEGEPGSNLAEQVSGRTYVCEPNALAIKEITFGLLSDPCVITLTTADDVQTVAAGKGTWVKGEMHTPQWKSANMAGSCAWKSGDSFRVKVIHTETPYMIHFDFRFDGNSMFMDTKLNVSMGPDAFPQIRGKAPGI
jgi:CubicO group peptidase (beta-lactamase class C family)